MIKLIDVSFYSNNNYNDLPSLITRHGAALGYVNYLSADVDIQVIKHLNYEGSVLIAGKKYSAFKGRNKFTHLPLKAINYIKKQGPDVVIIQGLLFPLQVIMLRNALGKRVIILVQHHGERPFGGVKKWMQRLADWYVNGYLFTSKQNAVEWISQKVIKHPTKCFELLEGSTHFTKQDKITARLQCRLTGEFNFLWVGRLNEGKDPLTVVNAFEKFMVVEPGARLYMIYQTEEFLPAIHNILNKNHTLRQKIILVGEVKHELLEAWYSAADYFISASRREGSGYALIEAMACGCIPVVTNIPTFNKITSAGKHGLLFSTGDKEDLLEKLKQLKTGDHHRESFNIMKHFGDALSFSSIARDLTGILNTLIHK